MSVAHQELSLSLPGIPTAAAVDLARPELVQAPERPGLYELAQVTEYTELNPEDFGLPTETKIHAVKVRDPYLEYMKAQDPEGIAAVEEWEGEVNDYVAKRREAGKWQRIPKPGYEMDAYWGDRETLQKIFADHGSPALSAWHEGVPSAVALAPLCDPINEGAKDILNTDGVKVGEMDERAALLFTALSDPRGIRSRGAVMAELIKNYVLHQVYDLGSGPLDLDFASIASGTALPGMSAIQSVVNLEAWKGQLLKNVSVGLFDKDKNAQSATKNLADKIEFQFADGIELHEVDLLNRKDMAAKTDELMLTGRRPKIQEIMGFFEYVSKEILGADPAKFLKSCYDLLDDGGLLIGGQMRIDRPNADFTEGAVCWPYVVRRSMAQVLEIAKQAGIPPEQIEFYLPEDGVYMVFAIRKPEKENQPARIVPQTTASLGHLATAA
jgi:hypothetical protein